MIRLPLPRPSLQINLYALHSLGPQVELLSGSRRFLAVYLSAGVVGTAASVAFTPAPSLGASGGYMGSCNKSKVRHQYQL